MSSRLLLLLGALLLPCAALGALGVRALVLEGERARALLRERAAAALETADRAFATTIAALPSGAASATLFHASDSGALLEPLAPVAVVSSSSDPRAEQEAAEAFGAVSGRVDALERAGDHAAAAATLARFETSCRVPSVGAAALTALGATLRRAGQLEAARGAYSRLLELAPQARDGRGLARGLPARLALAELSPAPREATVALALELAATPVPARDLAMRVFRERVRTLVGDDPRVARAFAETRARELPAVLERAFGADLGAWLARGAPGGVFRALDPEPTGEDVPSLVVSVRVASDGLRGGASEPAAIVRAALARPEVAALTALGFRARVAARAASTVTGRASGDAPAPSSSEGSPESATDVALASRPLPAPLADLTLSVEALDLAGSEAAERQRLLLGVALAVGALALASGAAVATVRAVSREVEAARAREQFTAAVTHELKTPLASIRLLGEILGQGGAPEPKVREFGGRILGEADRLSRLVAQVLELARIEGAPSEARPRARVPIAALADEVVRSFEPVARSRGFDVATTVRAGSEPAPGAAVLGDRDALAGALLNLLDNALKYSDGPNRLEVEVGGVGEKLTLAVLDRGRGVRPEDAPRIFRPFARGGDELTRDRPGVGLGLALVAGVARAHGGRATFEPRPGGGSRFALELPAAEESPGPPTVGLPIVAAARPGGLHDAKA